MAVIAGGIDIIYPPENADLHESIAETGLLVAEMPPGAQPTPRHFPIRNRIIGALALGVVVADAAERSGEVMAIPGSPLDPRSQGCNHLIREGATLVCGAGDILECLARPAAATLPDPADLRQARLAPGKPEEIDQCRSRDLARKAPISTR